MFTEGKAWFEFLVYSHLASDIWQISDIWFFESELPLSSFLSFLTWIWEEDFSAPQEHEVRTNMVLIDGLSWASLVAQLVKRTRLQCRRPGFNNPWVGKIPWRRKRLPPLQYSGLEKSMRSQSRTRLWSSSSYLGQAVNPRASVSSTVEGITPHGLWREKFHTWKVLRLAP